MLLLANVGEELAVADQSAGQGDDFAIPSFEHRRSLVAARQFLGALRVTRHFQDLCRAALAESARMSRRTRRRPARRSACAGPFRLGTKVIDRANAEVGEGRSIVALQPGKLGRSVDQAAAHPWPWGWPKPPRSRRLGNGRSESLAWLECGGRHRLGPLKSGTGSVGCSGSRCGWSRCPPLVVIGRPVGTAGSTRGRTGGTRP